MISINNSEHYTWGNNCDGWHLLKNEKLSIIEEKMPPGTSETLHYHERAQQFFYILKGKATFELDGITTEVGAGEGMHISPRQQHRILNNSPEDLHFLVVSEPKAHGDRTNIIEK